MTDAAYLVIYFLTLCASVGVGALIALWMGDL